MTTNPTHGQTMPTDPSRMLQSPGTPAPGIAGRTAAAGPWFRVWTVLLWALTAAALVIAMMMSLAGQAPTRTLLLLTVPIALIHGVRRYGATALLFFLAETLVISNLLENSSISTGFPFGDYYYTGGPKLFQVPIFIGPIYFGLGYICWHVANVLLDEADTRLSRQSGSGRRINVVALPMIAAALMAMFDLGSDSIASTVDRTWIWEDGGGVFGVPYTNYLGWWLVTYLCFQVFALYLSRRRATVSTERRGPLLQAVIIYAVLGLSSIMYFIGNSTGTVTDGAGVAWDGHAMNETLMTINIFAVLFVSLLALIKLARNDTVPTRAPMS